MTEWFRRKWTLDLGLCILHIHNPQVDVSLCPIHQERHSLISNVRTSWSRNVFIPFYIKEKQGKKQLITRHTSPEVDIFSYSMIIMEAKIVFFCVANKKASLVQFLFCHKSEQGSGKVRECVRINTKRKRRSNTEKRKLILELDLETIRIPDETGMVK